MEHELAMWTSPDPNSTVSATLGRAMSILLSARPKKLEEAISRLDSAPQRSSLVSLEESIRIFHSYATNTAKKVEPMDEVIVPMIEHSLKCTESKYGNQAMILFNWLFQDEVLFQALATNLAGIITRKEDRYISLGWCMLVRGLAENEITTMQFRNDGIKKCSSLLKIFYPCIRHLVSVVCNGSTLQGDFELPNRLAVAAADCILSLTSAWTKTDLVSYGSDEKLKQSNSSLSKLSTTLVLGEKRVKPASSSHEFSMEMKLLLWDHLDELIVLVQRLIAWSRKSSSLRAKGLGRVLKWLQGIKGSYAHVQNEPGTGSQILKTGVLLLSSCWKHYSMLMHLEDYLNSQHYKELLDQYLAGIQFFADNHTEEYTANKDSGIDTINFFLNCLSLLLGHLPSKQSETALSEDGLRISHVLISQLHCADEEVIDGAVSLLKAVIFRTNYSLAGSSPTDTRDMDAVLPLLLHLLDERDGTARAVVILIAEYCSISTNSQCLQEVLKRLASEDVLQRRNAVDVMSELFRLSPDVVRIFGSQDVANHLLERLGDEEPIVRAQASSLIPMMDPSLVLPALVSLLYSSDEALQSCASNTFVAVLKYHNKNFEVLCMLFNCLSNLCENPNFPDASGGSKLDAEILLKLIPQWSDSVEEWNLLVEPLIDKLFAEPSNAIIVKFLSYISEHLADAADVVFQRILLRTRQQHEWKSRDSKIDYPVKLAHSLFDRLCPLLIIKLLPLRVFNNLNSSLMYGVLRDKGYSDMNAVECVAGILLSRAFNKFEFDDVRRLAAELCGRIHPEVLVPIIASQLAHAASATDALKIKACLFSICTSLVIRGRDSILHPAVLEIRDTIESILLWPSIDGDEVSKAQHGCIDCLALMICTELQDPELFRDLTTKKSGLVGTASSRGTAIRNSVVSYVINQLTNDKIGVLSSKMDEKGCPYESSISLSFRMCMANVLISACQKMPNSGKKPFAREVLPRLIQSMGMIMESEIRAACVQVFFSAVYHLKSAILPCASNLLKVSLKSLTDGSDREKVSGAKLLTSLMAGEESVLESIAGGLLDARTLLSSIASFNTLPEVQQVCKQLIACLTYL